MSGDGNLSTDSPVRSGVAEQESDPGAGAPELGILPGAGTHIKNQKDLEPELSLKFRTRAGAMAI